MGKLKCDDVGPKHAGDSWRSGRNVYKTGDYFASGGQYIQCKKKSIDTTQGGDGRKTDATEYSQGRKRNGRRDSNNSSTNSKEESRTRERKCGMVRNYEGRENF